MSRPVLVLGGGLTGLQAAVELADAGVRAVVVEQGPVIGGKRAAWLAGESDLEPRLKAVGENENVELLTLGELESLEGEEGSFRARLRLRPRYVNDDCTRCNHCAPVCPEAVPNEYDAGLTARKAIHSPFPQTIPDVYAIDIDSPFDNYRAGYLEAGDFDGDGLADIAVSNSEGHDVTVHRGTGGSFSPSGRHRW